MRADVRNVALKMYRTVFMNNCNKWKQAENILIFSYIEIYIDIFHLGKYWEKILHQKHFMNRYIELPASFFFFFYKKSFFIQFMKG